MATKYSCNQSQLIGTYDFVVVVHKTGGSLYWYHTIPIDNLNPYQTDI